MSWALQPVVYHVGRVLRQQDGGSPALFWKHSPAAVTAGGLKGEFGHDTGWAQEDFLANHHCPAGVRQLRPPLVSRTPHACSGFPGTADPEWPLPQNRCQTRTGFRGSSSPSSRFSSSRSCQAHQIHWAAGPESEGPREISASARARPKERVPVGR